MLILLSVSFVLAYTESIPENGHGGDEFFIVVNGNSISLQDAIDNGEFDLDYVGSGNYSGVINLGHDGGRIMVNVGGVDKDLQDAIDDYSLCLSRSGGSGVYLGNISFGHSAGEVLLSSGGVEKSLQTLINEGGLGYEGWLPLNTDTCHDEYITQYNCGESQSVLGAKCCDRTWTPSTDTKCSTEQVAQTSNCGTTRSVAGTGCCDTTWTPASNTQCNGVSISQTSNCGNTRTSVGTKNCADSYGGANFYAFHYVCAWNPALDTCDGNGGTGVWFTCSATDSKACWDYAGGWYDGDYHCLRRYIVCR